MPYHKSNNRPPQPPAWRTIRPDAMPPRDQHVCWLNISWRQARRDLAAGLCLEFAVPAELALDFIAYVRCRLHVPVGVRVYPRRQRVVFFPKPRRRVRHPACPPTRSILRADFRNRLRTDAIIRTIVADAGTYLNGTPCGFDFRAALGLFIEEHGGDYGIAIPGVDALQGWIAAVECLELLQPYESVGRGDTAGDAPGDMAPGDAAGRPAGESAGAAAPDSTQGVQAVSA